jgi:hypothetical protein
MSKQFQPNDKQNPKAIERGKAIYCRYCNKRETEGKNYDHCQYNLIPITSTGELCPYYVHELGPNYRPDVFKTGTPRLNI